MTSVSGLSGERFEVVVVGGGLAGLATAASLCSQGCHSILVLESETVPGAHSSGKNAGLVRQAAEDPQTTVNRAPLCAPATGYPGPRLPVIPVVVALVAGLWGRLG